MAIVDFKLPTLLARSPQLAKSLNTAATDARWWIGVALATLVMISMSPYVGQRWFKPYPTADEIASAVVKALPQGVGVSREVAPKPPPPKQPLTPKEEEALQGLSSVLNGKGSEILKLSEKPMMLLNPMIGIGNLTPHDVRDKLQALADALASMETSIYREFIPANRYYKTELLAALGAESDEISKSPVYQYGQFVGTLAGRMNLIATVVDEVKTPNIIAQLMTFAYQMQPELRDRNDKFKEWIDNCNARIQQRKAQK